MTSGFHYQEELSKCSTMEDIAGPNGLVQRMVKDAIKLAVYAESFGGALQMTDDITYFITHWEAEAYRSKK